MEKNFSREMLKNNEGAAGGNEQMTRDALKKLVVNSGPGFSGENLFFPAFGLYLCFLDESYNSEANELTLLKPFSVYFAEKGTFGLNRAFLRNFLRKSFGCLPFLQTKKKNKYYSFQEQIPSPFSLSGKRNKISIFGRNNRFFFEISPSHADLVTRNQQIQM